MEENATDPEGHSRVPGDRGTWEDRCCFERATKE